jgi:hypothetical protein
MEKEFTIDLLERHRKVPTQEEMLEGYVHRFAGQRLGSSQAAAPVVEPEPVLPEPVPAPVAETEPEPVFLSFDLPATEAPVEPPVAEEAPVADVEPREEEPAWAATYGESEPVVEPVEAPVAEPATVEENPAWAATYTEPVEPELEATRVIAAMPEPEPEPQATLMMPAIDALEAAATEAAGPEPVEGAEEAPADGEKPGEAGGDHGKKKKKRRHR